MVVKLPDRCTKCGFGLFSIEEDPDDSSITAVCASCGNRVELFRKTPKAVVIPREDIAIKSRRLPGLTRAEAQRLYRDSPAGKAAWDRYRYSDLFYRAHAKHRATETYAETQKRFKEKRRLFSRLLNPPLESTCPLNLFYKGPNGEIYHNAEACDFNNNDCKLGCITHDGDQE